MLITVPNRTYQKQANKLIPATFKKAIVTQVYPNSYTVDVYIVGNNQTILKNIAVAATVDISAVSPGDRCKLDLFSESNPNDMVMSYTYGKPQVATSATGTTSISYLGTNIPHGLGRVPAFVSVLPNSAGSFFQNSPADATYLHLTYNAAMGSLPVTWYVE